MKILFIGLNPSSKNSDPNTPFVGTKSAIILDHWIDAILLNQDDYSFTNAVDDVVTSNSEEIKAEDFIRNSDRLRGKILKEGPDVVVMLGSKVYEFLSKYNFLTKQVSYPGPVFLRWPHPSPKNRFLNDKGKVEDFIKHQQEVFFNIRKNH